MNLRFVNQKVHALLDYPVAFTLIGSPYLLGIGNQFPIARQLSIIAGIAALVLTMLTNHETGIVRVLPYWFHLAVDRLVGVTFLAAPLVLGFGGLDAAYYWINGLTVLAVTTILNAPDPRLPSIIPESPRRAA